MSRMVLRIWLPDRPGALGAVASRVGAVRADVVGIEVVERDGGVAVDDLVVDLPDDSLVEIMLAEVRQVDGVRVEDVHSDSSAPADPTAGAFESARFLMTAPGLAELAQLTVETACRLVGGDWCCLIDEKGAVVSSHGPVPHPSWLAAFRDGVKAGGADGPADPVLLCLPAPRWDLLMGRQSRALRSRERERLGGLASLAAARWAELGRQLGRQLHPASRSALAIYPA
jgi:hypothetical protein